MIAIKHILVATDFSAPSDAALVYGKDFARTYGAALHVLHVVDNLGTRVVMAPMAITPDVGTLQAELEAGARLALDDLLTDEDRRVLHARSELRTSSQAAETIVAYARDAAIDLIIIGTHGRTGLTHFFMGSVAQHVVRMAPCPVLTVRHPEREFVQARRAPDDGRAVIAMRPRLWNIVLAAGAGQRLAAVTGGIPKQFWSVDGGPTLLEDTLARAAVLAPAEHTVIVVDRSHRRFVQALPRVARRGRVVYQPADRGTAAGVLFGLSEVVARDSDAMVVIMPSDHGVAKPTLFVDGIVAAVADVERHRANVVLLAVVPSHPDRDYGWICSGGCSTGAGLRRVSAFVEKPDAVTAARLFDAGAVWNTMVLVARAQTLLQLFQRHLPELTRAFQAQVRYDGLPRADFSRDLIARAGELFVRTWPAEMGWSDLGTPDRLGRWRASHADLQLVG